MSSTGMVRGKGELLRAVAVRLAIVGGLAVAAWLAGAVTANAAEVSARAGDPSPSAVSKQGEQSMDAPVRVGTYGSADPAAAGTATADQAVTDGDQSTATEQSAAPAQSATQSATQSAHHALTGPSQTVTTSSLAGPRVPTAAGALDGASTQPSARPHHWTGAQPWSTSDSRPAARPSTSWPTAPPTTSTQPTLSADALCAQAMTDAVPDWSGSGTSGPGRDDATASDATDDSTADGSAANDSGTGDYSGAYWSDGWDTDDAIDESTWSSNPMTGADGERAAPQAADSGSDRALASGPADLTLDPAPIHVSRAAARSGSPQRALRHAKAVDSTGAPALPRPGPEPQPVPLAPSVPSASPSGQQGNGGPRGVLAVLPAQSASAGTAALDRVRFVGSVPVPGVQDQPITSPD